MNKAAGGHKSDDFFDDAELLMTALANLATSSNISRKEIRKLLSELSKLPVDDGAAICGMTDAIARTIGKAN